MKEPNGVDLYKDVEVNFISGRKAVLTIFKDGKEQEKITLSDYNDKDKLTHLFAEKGFNKYSDEELTERRKMKEEQEKQDAAAAANAPAGPGGARNLKGKAKRNLMGGGRKDAKLRKQELKDRLKKLKDARENFMVVGQPLG